MKKIVFYLSLVLINLTGLFIVLLIYFILINLNIIYTPKIISNNKLYRKIHSALIFSKKEQILMKIMDESYIDFYPALELGGDYEHLSRKLFDFPTISGEKTFIHKPNIKKLMTIIPIEEGRNIRCINFSLPYDQKLKNLIYDMVVNSTTEENLKYFQFAAAEFDDNGFRRNSLPSNKNFPNILFAGDSYTEGLYVNDNETFVDRMREIMDNEKYAYPVNAGSNGYGTINEFLIIKEYAAKLNIKAVILIHCFNDIINSQEVVFKGNHPDLNKAWDKNLSILISIDEFCKSSKMKFIVAPYPNLFQYINPDIESKKNYQSRLGDFCEKKSIVFIDIYDDIKERLKINGEKLNKKNKETILYENDFYEEKLGENIYIPFDDHLSAYGHKVFADILWEKIKELNFKL